MPSPNIHIHCCTDPLVPGGSLTTMCPVVLYKSFIVAQVADKDSQAKNPTAEIAKPARMCNKCWFAIWPSGLVYQVCEADSAPDLVAESNL